MVKNKCFEAPCPIGTLRSPEPGLRIRSLWETKRRTGCLFLYERSKIAFYSAGSLLRVGYLHCGLRLPRFGASRRYRGLRPARSCGVDAQRLLLAASTLDGRKYGPSPAVEATSSAEVASRRAGWRRLAAPAAHPSGVLSAASTLIQSCITLCDPPGRAPDAAPSRRAPFALLMASPPASSAGRGGKQKTQRVRLARVGRAAASPAEGRTASLVGSLYPKTRKLRSKNTCDRRSLGPATLLFGLAPIPPSGFAAGRGGRRS